MLPAVLELYKSEPKWITGKYKTYKTFLMSGNVFREFKCALKTCSAAQADSTERYLLQQVQGVHENFMRILKTPLAQASRSQAAQIMAPSEQQLLSFASDD